MTVCSVTGRDLEQDFRDRLMALRSQSEQESEALLQQVEQERSALQEELRLLRAQEARLQEELSGAALVSSRLLPLFYFLYSTTFFSQLLLVSTFLITLLHLIPVC